MRPAPGASRSPPSPRVHTGSPAARKPIVPSRPTTPNSACWTCSGFHGEGTPTRRPSNSGPPPSTTSTGRSRTTDAHGAHGQASVFVRARCLSRSSASPRSRAASVASRVRSALRNRAFTARRSLLVLGRDLLLRVGLAPLAHLGEPRAVCSGSRLIISRISSGPRSIWAPGLFVSRLLALQELRHPAELALDEVEPEPVLRPAREVVVDLDGRERVPLADAAAVALLERRRLPRQVEVVDGAGPRLQVDALVGDGVGDHDVELRRSPPRARR
jgi:hypothetical protein